MLRVRLARLEDLPELSLVDAPAWMGEAERRRSVQGSATARAEFIAGRALLRRVLEGATGFPPEAWSVSADAGRAPLVRGPSHVHASLSHRLGWVAAAVSDSPVGIDVECLRPGRSTPHERACLMLASEELPAWNALRPAARESALLERWTAKEAWFKAAPVQDAAWDFRRVVASACEAARANVRVWLAPPLYVAVCSHHPGALAEAQCEALPGAHEASTFWHVALA
jgi:phosphopantetheinyl transferase